MTIAQTATRPVTRLVTDNPPAVFAVPTVVADVVGVEPTEEVVVELELIDVADAEETTVVDSDVEVVSVLVIGKVDTLD